MSSSALAQQEVDARADVTMPVCFYLDRGQITNLKSYASKTGTSYSEVFSQIITFGDARLAEQDRRLRAKAVEKAAIFGYPDPVVHAAFEDAERIKEESENLEKSKARRRDPAIRKVIEDYLKKWSAAILKKKLLGGGSSTGQEGTVRYDGEEG